MTIVGGGHWMELFKVVKEKVKQQTGEANTSGSSKIYNINRGLDAGQFGRWVGGF